MKIALCVCYYIDLAPRVAGIKVGDAIFRVEAESALELDKKISKVFLPSDESWLKHANPWSVWSRFATLPFIALSVWSRVWIGWYCVIPITLLILWLWINPTLSSKPSNFNSWGARAVLGERVWMSRKENPLPEGSLKVVSILNVLQLFAGLVLIYGLWTLDVSYTIHGMVYVYLSKMWFLDRMVWLYESESSKSSKPRGQIT